MEMDLHRSYAAELGISRARTAAHFVELTAALLPCIWGYAEIAERLAGGGALTVLVLILLVMALAQPGQERRAREPPVVGDLPCWQLASLRRCFEVGFVYPKQRRGFGKSQDLRSVFSQGHTPDDESVVGEMLAHRVFDQLTLALARGGNGIFQAAIRLGR